MFLQPVDQRDRESLLDILVLCNQDEAEIWVHPDTHKKTYVQYAIKKISSTKGFSKYGR